MAFFDISATLNPITSCVESDEPGTSQQETEKAARWLGRIRRNYRYMDRAELQAAREEGRSFKQIGKYDHSVSLFLAEIEQRLGEEK
jgi:Tfp pilus assembly protein PilF